MSVQSATETLFLTQQIQKQVAAFKSEEVYLSIDIKYVGVKTKGAHEKFFQKCYMLQKFSASEGPWLSEESSLTHLCILRVQNPGFPPQKPRALIPYTKEEFLILLPCIAPPLIHIP